MFCSVMTSSLLLNWQLLLVISNSLFHCCLYSLLRYRNAGVEPPLAVYVDKGCCRDTDAPTQLSVLLSPWTTPVRLDIFHYMNRFRFCCTTEAHPLYGEFMARLSGAIFEWDKNDMSNLVRAKKSTVRGGNLMSDQKVCLSFRLSKVVSAISIHK